MRRYDKVVARVAKGLKAMIRPEDAVRMMEDVSGTAYEANEVFKEIFKAMEGEDYNTAFRVMNHMSPRLLRWLPNEIVEFLQTASKKESGSESWQRNVLRDMETILVRSGGADVVWGPYYLTNRENTSNKFHYFVVYGYQDTKGSYMYVGANAYGRIGKPAKVFEISRSPSKNSVINTVSDKMNKKRGEGYEEE